MQADRLERHPGDPDADALERQGYEVSSWLKWYDKVAWGWLEPSFSPALHLSVTAALEHLTASLAEEVLGHDLLGRA